jgi:hypothetical protein
VRLDQIARLAFGIDPVTGPSFGVSWRVDTSLD